jgi:glycosyltransferase involved in cell wall biosynthesis
MKYLEENYISVVVIARNDENIADFKIAEIYKTLKNNFKYFEIIVVDNNSDDRTQDVLNKIQVPITVVNLSKRHNTQQALTAGVEIAIGDYIVEIPDMSVDFDAQDIMDLYDVCLKNNDFVFLTPEKIRNTSKLFYKILNWNFKDKISAPILPSIMTLSSRRGQNKTSDEARRVVNRSVSYVLTGLNCAEVTKNVKYHNRRGLFENISLMADTLIHHTDYVIQLVMVIALLFLGLAFLGVIYGFIMYFYIEDPTRGWASSFVLNSAAFCAIFVILSVVCRYLSLILNSQNTKPYTFRSLTKKGKG